MAWTINMIFTSISITSFVIEPSMQEINLDTEMQERLGLKRCNYGLSNCGNKIPDNLWPRKAFSQTGRKTFPHIIGLAGYYGFSKPLKELVESLEPGIHDFRPVEVIRKDLKPAEMQFFAVNINWIVDEAIDFKLSGGIHKQYGSRMNILPLSNADSGKIFISRDAVLGKHLWITEEIVGRPLTVSNALFDEMSSQKLLRGFRGYELREI